MELLKTLSEYKDSNRTAMISGEKRMSYRQLWEQSDRLAKYIKRECGDDKTPVIVYGHKDPMMLAAFLACAKSGRAYVPLDVNMPQNRIESILDAVQPRLVLTTERMKPYGSCRYADIVQDAAVFQAEAALRTEDYVKEDEVYYIIFTSGSTGEPKGVQITYGALNRFVEWALTLGICEKRRRRVLNQAPFSFDLSVMDVYMSLAAESSLFSLDREVQADYKKLFQSLKDSDVNIWVSTPSFAELCLADPLFSQALLPEMELFLFCGETLTNKTASALLERFPKAQVWNTYGPTESTVAVTQVCVDEKLLQKYDPLPVGAAKPGTRICILGGGMEPLADEEKGEIVIVGDTLSKGYFKNEKENSRAFFQYLENGRSYRAYRTGDKGYMKEGQLFYCGRLDLQIKLHGYRMEVEDIEKNLMKVPGIRKAVVVPIDEGGKVKYLQAVCVYREPVSKSRKLQKLVKERLAEFVPAYMIPRKIQFVDEIPVTANGKADRKKVKEMCGCRFIVD